MRSVSPIPLFLLGFGSLAMAADPLPADLQAAVAAAAAGGAPVELLENKAREGIAKGVPASRIAGALQAWATDWVRADAVVGAAQDDVITAAAAALRGGVDPGAVRDLAATAMPSESLWTLVDVVNLGLPPPVAEHLVALAARSAQPAVALRLLPEATRASVAQWGAVAAPSHLEDALNHGQIEALSHGQDGSPGKSGEPHGNSANAPGHSGDHGNGNGNGNGNGGGKR